MKQNTYLNSPVKTCDNCAYQRKADYGMMECARPGHLCEIERMWSMFPMTQCDENWSGWRPRPQKPPRRSLRQWLLDTFWETR